MTWTAFVGDPTPGGGVFEEHPGLTWQEARRIIYGELEIFGDPGWPDQENATEALTALMALTDGDEFERWVDGEVYRLTPTRPEPS